MTPPSFAVFGAIVITAVRAAAQPVDRFLIGDRNAEIAMARSAAPEAISGNATVLVLTRHGYEVAVKGTNGFVCLVERAWVGAVDAPEFWNAKIRGPDCLNAQAARFLLPLAQRRSVMVMAGRSQAELLDAELAQVRKHDLPRLELGAMGYMMSKAAYLTDQNGHNGSHLMFWVPQVDSAGGNLSPQTSVGSVSYWSMSGNPRLKDAPPIRIFMVQLEHWSDGTAAAGM